MVGSGTLTWMPTTDLTFFLRYRHFDLDVDTPPSATITDLDDASNSYTYGVKQGISFRDDRVTLAGRYRAARRLTLRARYVFDERDRDEASEWGLPDSTTRHTVGLSADARPLDTLGLKAEYAYTSVEDPDYNMTPDLSHRAGLSATWTPASRVSAYLSYGLTRGLRDGVAYEGGGAGERETTGETFLASGTFMLRDDLNLTASYAFLQNEVVQDLQYQTLSGAAAGAPGSVYRDTAHGFSLGAGWLPTERLTLSATAAYTKSKGTLETPAEDLLQPVSVPSLVEFRLAEKSLALAADYRLGRGLDAGLNYKYLGLGDVPENAQDFEGGKVQILMVKASKKW
jgi:hypothetical protein